MRKGGADKGDRMENEKLDFHKKVYEGFCDIANKDKDRVVRIDASVDADGVFEQIRKALESLGI